MICAPRPFLKYVGWQQAGFNSRATSRPARVRRTSAAGVLAERAQQRLQVGLQGLRLGNQRLPGGGLHLAELIAGEAIDGEAQFADRGDELFGWLHDVIIPRIRLQVATI